MKTTRVIPLQVGRVRIQLAVTIIDPDDHGSEDAKTAARAGKGRLPETVRIAIEEQLKAGKRVAEVRESTGVSEPTIYLIRTHLRRAGLVQVPAFGRTTFAPRGRKAEAAPYEPQDSEQDDVFEDDMPDVGDDE